MLIFKALLAISTVLATGSAYRDNVKRSQHDDDHLDLYAREVYSYGKELATRSLLDDLYDDEYDMVRRNLDDDSYLTARELAEDHAVLLIRDLMLDMQLQARGLGDLPAPPRRKDKYRDTGNLRKDVGIKNHETEKWKDNVRDGTGSIMENRAHARKAHAANVRILRTE